MAIQLRGHFKRFLNNKPTKYLAVQMLYKNISYRHHSFKDCIEPGHCDSPDSYVHYSRTESAFVLGLDLIVGQEVDLGSFFSDGGVRRTFGDRIHLDVFYGLGYRFRSREYTTVVTNYPFPGPTSPPEGTFHLNQTYPTINFGIKLGLNFQNKKQ